MGYRFITKYFAPLGRYENQPKYCLWRWWIQLEYDTLCSKVNQNPKKTTETYVFKRECVDKTLDSGYSIHIWKNRSMHIAQSLRHLNCAGFAPTMSRFRCLLFGAKDSKRRIFHWPFVSSRQTKVWFPMKFTWLKQTWFIVWSWRLDFHWSSMGASGETHWNKEETVLLRFGLSCTVLAATWFNGLMFCHFHGD